MRGCICRRIDTTPEIGNFQTESENFYEKYLGPNTTKLADVITAYHPNSIWHKAERAGAPKLQMTRIASGPRIAIPATTIAASAVFWSLEQWLS
jgi:hypothetical protein